MKRLVIGVLACFSLVTPARGADPQPAPVALELGTLADGTYSRAWTLNDSGQVVGFSTVSPGPPMSLGVPFHPFSWTRAGGMIDLGTLGGRFGAMATAVNGAGQVVGTSWTPDDGFHPFSWTPAGGMIDLGSLGGLYASAAGVSSSGQVFGSSDTATGEQHIFSWTPAGGMIDLGTLGGTFAYAAAVSKTGEVVGGSSLPGCCNEHAFLWTQVDGMIDLGTLGGTYGAASAVNDQGDVVGFSNVAGDAETHPFLWTKADGMVDLGTFGGPIGFAGAVSASSQIVGSSLTATGEWHAFSWTPTGGMVDLGTLGGMNSLAFALSDAGQVVGQSDTPSGFQQGFLWTPSGGMVSLATLPNTSSEAVAINARGQIVGSRGVAPFTSPDDETHAMLWELSPPFVTVSIDIKPGSSENTINLHSHGVVPVAILSDASFDATHVDASTVTLADASVRIEGNGRPMAEVRDVNGDGRPDLVVNVETDAMTLAASDVTATLTGRTLAGLNIQGSDIVRLLRP